MFGTIKTRISVIPLMIPPVIALLPTEVLLEIVRFGLEVDASTEFPSDQDSTMQWSSLLGP